MINQDKFRKLKDLTASKVMVLDGAFGTMVQRLNLKESEYRSLRFKDHQMPLKGCNDVLALSRQDIVEEIHRNYLEAGADIIKTSSFNTNSVSLSDYGLENSVYEMAKASARIASKVAKEFSDKTPDKPRFVAGSVGPTNKTSSISANILDPSAREITFTELKNAYSEQIRGLLDGGADIILIETIFDTLNAKAALYATEEIGEERNEKIPVMVSVTFSDSSGRTLSGQTIEAFYASMSHVELLSIGMNCAFGAAKLYPWLKRLSEISRFPVSVHPNAGLPDISGNYHETPESFAAEMSKFIDEGLVNIVGGCCGTTPDHIKALTKVAEGKKPRLIPENEHKLLTANLEALCVTRENNFINIGERTNVAGSAKFARLIREEKYDDALEIARSQVKSGAQIIDVCMDQAMIDGVKAMKKFLNLMASEPEISRVPVMIDSSVWEVLETGMQVCQGKCIVNSISLKEGEEKFLERASKLRKFGAAAVVMLFDEKGQADTLERKIEVAQRSYNLLTKAGFPPEDIIFDPNILAIGTGIPEHDRYAADFIEATRWIKENLPYAKVSGGLSNLSFSFRGNNAAREAMHSVFLYHAIQAGMDMAILNPGMLKLYTDMDPELLEKTEDLILCRRKDATERFLGLIARREKEKEESEIENSGESIKGKNQLSLHERIEEALLKGENKTLNEDVEEAFSFIGSAIGVIDTVLMPAMNKVGELFGEGKMFLPQVVKSARVMKQAVDILMPHLEKHDSARHAGKVVIATVKGDVHDIGKNIVSVVVECNGYDVRDLGVMADTAYIIDEAVNMDADAILLSGLITPSLHEMTKVCEELEKRNLKIPVIVGGATTSALFTAVKISPVYEGAVIHASDAAANAIILNRLLSPGGEGFVKKLKEEQKIIRENYSRERERLSLVSYNEAQRRKEKRKAEEVPLKENKRHVFKDVDVKEIEPFIDWNFFFNSWGLKGKYPEILEDPIQGEEARRLSHDAQAMLERIKKEKLLSLQGVMESFNAHSEGDDIVIEKDGSIYRLPMLRSQNPENGFLSVTDFIGEKSDQISLFAVTAGIGLKKETESLKGKDEYQAIMLKLLADRLAEAFAEYLGKHTDGCRLAFGYPALPDHSLKKDAFEILKVEEDCEMRLTENYMIDPGESVCGIFVKGGRYFRVGIIDEDQLKDYARRRGVAAETVKKMIPNNL